MGVLRMHFCVLLPAETSRLQSKILITCIRTEEKRLKDSVHVSSSNSHSTPGLISPTTARHKTRSSLNHRVNFSAETQGDKTLVNSEDSEKGVLSNMLRRSSEKRKRGSRIAIKNLKQVTWNNITSAERNIKRKRVDRFTEDDENKDAQRVDKISKNGDVCGNSTMRTCYSESQVLYNDVIGWKTSSGVVGTLRPILRDSAVGRLTSDCSGSRVLSSTRRVEDESHQRASTLPEDPRCWSRDDVHSWLQAMCISDVVSERFRMNGKALCLMTSDMFEYRVQVGKVGVLLYKDFRARLHRAVALLHHRQEMADDENIVLS